MFLARRDRIAFTVALTGGIASGKSAVAHCFERLGVTLIDADAIAHQLVQPGQAALDDISAAFGNGIITTSGELDRRLMRNIVFDDATARRTLEAILHPKIHSAIVERVGASNETYCVVAIPLFIEVRASYAWMDRILVTDVTRAAQLERLAQRPQIDAQLAVRVVDAQASREQRLQMADDVVDNMAPIERLPCVVDRLHDRYTRLSRL